MNKQRINIYEVGPRDGLQNEKLTIPTQIKINYIDLLSDTGLQNIEVSSFVKPGAIPQLSDAQQVFTGITQKPGLNYSALVPNRKGLEQAKAAGVKEIAVFTAASEQFTQKNINASISESLERIREVATICRDVSHPQIRLRGYVSTIIQCPYAGRIKPETVLKVCQQLLDAGVYQISLGETIGVAVPGDLARLLDVVLKKIPVDKLAGHYHDTRGTGLANIFKSLEYGIKSFDSSSAGLGGCPYAPGAAGNLATEDLVYALDRSGFHTGVDLSKLARASKYIMDVLGRPAASRVLQTF